MFVEFYNSELQTIESSISNSQGFPHHFFQLFFLLDNSLTKEIWNSHTMLRDLNAIVNSSLEAFQNDGGIK